jgi:hypothetical protein
MYYDFPEIFQIHGISNNPIWHYDPIKKSPYQGYEGIDKSRHV